MYEQLLTLIRGMLSPGEDIDGDTPLLTSGLLSSFKFTELVAHAEGLFDVQIDLDDLGADNFNTPNQMLNTLTELKRTKEQG